MPLNPTVPGPPASVLTALLRGGVITGDRRRFTWANGSPAFPFLPSLGTDVVWLSGSGIIDGNLLLTGIFQSAGWATSGVTPVTAAYTTLPTDAVVLANATSAAYQVTLADATQQGFALGQRYTIIKTDSSGNAVTVGTSAGQTINGSSTQSLSSQWAFTEVIFDGANWEVISASAGGGGGGVTSVTAGDTSIVIGGTGTAPTVRTGTLDVVAAQHPPAANWSNNSHKITSLANGTASSDAAAFGQIGVTSVTATDTSIVVGGSAGAPTVATGTLDVIAADHPPAANWSNNSHKITSLANGSGAQDAAAFGQIPTTATAIGGMAQQAATTTSGYTLVNGTGDVITWTTPSDGNPHPFMVLGGLDVATTEVGGNLVVIWTLPDGTASGSGISLFAGAKAGPGVFQSNVTAIAEAGTTVTVHQQTALTSGASKLFAAIFGL